MGKKKPAQPTQWFWLIWFVVDGSTEVIEGSKLRPCERKENIMTWVRWQYEDGTTQRLKVRVLKKSSKLTNM